MKSRLFGLLLPAALLLAGCATSGGEGQTTKGGQKVAETSQGTPTPRAYSKDLDELRAAFDRDKGRVRLVTLLSPT